VRDGFAGALEDDDLPQLLDGFDQRGKAGFRLVHDDRNHGGAR